MRQTLLLLLILTVGVESLHAAITAAPEIDTSSMGSAFALLVGGYLVVVAKYRRK
jgi:hypothetical protein